jgi:hypothetical protein
MRLCMDYRGLNDITVKDRILLLLISKTLDRLSGAQVFSALNLKDAYYRIPIKKGDEWKTAVRTRYRHFEFCVVYLDDILIYSKNNEEHTRHLRLVLERLRKYGLYANRKKCHFYIDSVDFLGFVVSN